MRSTAGFRPGPRPDSNCSPASTCRARRSASSSSMRAPRRTSRLKSCNGSCANAETSWCSTAGRSTNTSASPSRAPSTCRARNWCCASASSPPRRKPWWWSIAAAGLVLLDAAAEGGVMRTASWLRMGWCHVFLVVQQGEQTAPPAAPPILAPPPPELRIDCGGLGELMARDEATVIDLSLSREYLRAHIPGAWFAIRSRLERALAKIPLRGTLVLTSEDGVLAGCTLPEARSL